MKEFIVDENYDGIRLDKFMSKVMPNVKAGEIYKSLRKKKVRINSKHKDGAYRLHSGDKVCIYMNDECFGCVQPLSWDNCSDDIEVVYEDGNIIIVNKPSGLASQECGNCADSLESRIRAYLYNKGEINLDASPPFIPSLCHRIDRNTSGLVIAAKNAAALRDMNQKIKEKKIRKFYILKTERTPNPPNGEICGWLVRDKKRRLMHFFDSKPHGSDAVCCKTIYRTLKQGSPCVVEAELLTGKTHQLRVSFAHIGCPICGDVKYGATVGSGSSYQELTSYKLIFDFDPDGGPLDYISHRIFSTLR